jgi:hypothetical protein
MNEFSYRFCLARDAPDPPPFSPCSIAVLFKFYFMPRHTSNASLSKKLCIRLVINEYPIYIYLACNRKLERLEMPKVLYCPAAFELERSMLRRASSSLELDQIDLRQKRPRLFESGQRGLAVEISTIPGRKRFPWSLK